MSTVNNFPLCEEYLQAYKSMAFRIWKLRPSRKTFNTWWQSRELHRDHYLYPYL